MLARRDFFSFFFLGRLVTCRNKRGESEREKRVGRWREKALRGKRLLKRSNTGEGDTLTSCMRCHGYQSPVCHPSLVPPFPPPLPNILAFERQREDTKGDERREGYREEGKIK